MEEKSIESLAEELGRAALKHGARIATAESCTAGGISYAITSVPGSSGWFDRGFVTYTERSKIEMLGVPMGVIRSRGVVSEDVAAAMAQGRELAGKLSCVFEEAVDETLLVAVHGGE